MGILKRIAPIFAVRDLDAAMVHYQRLGFVTRAKAAATGMPPGMASRFIWAGCPTVTTGPVRRICGLRTQTS
jgi:hypothetical protein